MAVVYPRVNGRKLTKIIAMHTDVQQELTDRAGEMGYKAEWLLAGHRHEGHAKIVVEKGDVDRHIILDDERGLLAAWVIEHGRKGDENGKGAMEGTWALHDATGLPR